MDGKLCVIYNFAQRYRAGIFKRLDEEYECDWYFGKNRTDIKELDIALLKRVKRVPNVFIKGPIYYQRGVTGLLFDGRYKCYLMLGELFCLSTWMMLILNIITGRHKKIYLWSHGWYGRESRIRRVLKKVYFKMSDGVFLYGNHARNLMLEEGFNGRKLHVIHNSLDYDAQKDIRRGLRQSEIYKRKFENDNPNIIFIGRLTKSKRIDLLLEAVKRLKGDGTMTNLTLVGDGEHRAELEKMTERLGIRNQVWFHGACYEEERNAEMLYNADVCVSPGNVGLTAVHAMVYGCPVITHDNFSYQGPEFEAIMSGVTGDFFAYDNVDSLTNAIKGWIGHDEGKRGNSRIKCEEEIARNWTPEFQMNVLKSVFNG